MKSIDPELAREACAFARVLAGEAMERLRGAAHEAHSVLVKAPGDWASALDSDIEAMLRERIAGRFPGHAFLGEEGGGATAQGRDTGPTWIVDPIDGSMNFLRGYPQYAVSIALVDGGEPLAGVVGDPCRNEVFSAAAGQGAWLGDTPIRCATTSRLDKAVAGTVFPKPAASFMPRYLDQFGRVVTRTAGVRRSGSMALELAYLAAGRLDAFWEHGMGAWDAAAGVLLVREAGGEVFTMDGEPWLSSAQIAAAAAPVAHDWRELLAA
ncbi:MAG: inositol monophosphatase [Gammaproteobacteria bacterium]|nr:inositol monophosphatase [Gammaproteobacteria bacterium]MBU1443436.1 inositol monophosphatase [Gammaproteobacteria bacterium]MBU2286410.1 inositol monophosphatase [Gammaproteobacteria bacterium]